MKQNMNFRPAFAYFFRDYLMGVIPFFGVMTALIILTEVIGSITGNAGSLRFSGFGFASYICLFVLGVVTPRPNLRLCAQFGVSRRTAFLSQLAAVALAALALCAGGELLVWAAQVLSGPQVLFADIYQMMIGLEDSAGLTLSGHLASMGFNLCMMLFFFAFGMLFTTVYWRLNKFWMIVVSISIPVLCNVIPLTLYWADRFTVVRQAMVQIGWFLAASPWNIALVSMVMGALFTVISYLLVRRANIREPASH